MGLLKTFQRVHPAGDPPTAREFVESQRRLEESISGMVRLARTLAPIGSCIEADISVAAQTKGFDDTGLGRVGGDWEGWAIRNGNNGTTNAMAGYTYLPLERVS
jgi:hypothetical protein